MLLGTGIIHTNMLYGWIRQHGERTHTLPALFASDIMEYANSGSHRADHTRIDGRAARSVYADSVAAAHYNKI